MPADDRQRAAAATPPAGVVPAGFWLRYAAWSLDALAVLPLATWLAWPTLHAGLTAAGNGFNTLLGASSQRLTDALVAGHAPAALADALLADPLLRAAASAVQDGLGRALWAWLLAYALVATLWHVIGTHSAWRASPGKRLLGLAVTDTAGAPLGWTRALARHLAAALSWLTLNLGHAMIALPPTHRALHDRLAGTRVQAQRGPHLPAWARTWIALQLLAGALLLAWWWLDWLHAVQASLAS